MIEIDLTKSNVLDPDMSIASLMSQVLREMESTKKPACHVRMMLAGGNQVTVRITYLPSKTRVRPGPRPPAMTQSEKRK